MHSQVTTPTLELKDYSLPIFLTNFKVWFCAKKLFGPEIMISSNADGISTLKSLSKVDVPSALEANCMRRTKQFFLHETTPWCRPKNKNLWESLSLWSVLWLHIPIFQIFIFKIDSGLETKGSILNSFPLLCLMLIIGKRCAMTKPTQKAQKFLKHESISYGALFRSVQDEQCAYFNCRDFIVI